MRLELYCVRSPETKVVSNTFEDYVTCLPAQLDRTIILGILIIREKLLQLLEAIYLQHLPKPQYFQGFTYGQNISSYRCRSNQG
jgi:hypothetical protein